MPKTLITRPKFTVNKPISSESVKQTKQKKPDTNQLKEFKEKLFSGSGFLKI